MKKSISKRIKRTKRGKILHRVKGQAHAKSTKGNQQRQRKKGYRTLVLSARVINKHLK